MDLSVAVWRKSTYSSGNGGQCVEVASNLPRVVAVRDSKNTGVPALLTAPGAWCAFIEGVKAGHLGTRVVGGRR
ncbi:hypothetical protein Ssi03_42400 [Sphaerisporangium siamense]|uniref:DUF397 domain-containing protein n=1 Tax=Sphaerisporangium siamense TaxID=795645 RepID=A0A7W7GF24_9ACTN|nr:DUF397 domain-containing protein [Sphaerisporangium siamense]MBB4704636.1 hypothetical protein [Sphaerisporangium siamense]GII86250.1 hypothetical protein Ssi03_42400 [Sphaerisporangium siamense]